MELSVIIPVHNAGHFLRLAVKSILEQKIEGCEVIIVDDASSDMAVEDLSAHDSIEIVRFPKQRGIGAAQNEGLRIARGRFVTFLDQDDLSVPNALPTLLGWLKERPGEVVVGGELGGVIGASGEWLGHPCSFYGRAIATPEELSLASFSQNREFPTALWLYMFERSFIRSLGPIDDTFRFATDREFIFRVLSRRHIPMLKVPMVFRRLHGNNHSGKLTKDSFQIRREAVAESILINLQYGIQ